MGCGIWGVDIWGVTHGPNGSGGLSRLFLFLFLPALSTPGALGRPSSERCCERADAERWSGMALVLEVPTGDSIRSPPPRANCDPYWPPPPGPPAGGVCADCRFGPPPIESCAISSRRSTGTDAIELPTEATERPPPERPAERPPPRGHPLQDPRRRCSHGARPPAARRRARRSRARRRACAHPHPPATPVRAPRSSRSRSPRSSTASARASACRACAAPLVLASPRPAAPPEQ